MSTGQGGLSYHEWITRIEKRLENLETESAQKVCKHEDKDTDMFKAVWAEINTLKTDAAVNVWKFGLIAAVGTVVLGGLAQVILKKAGWL